MTDFVLASLNEAASRAIEEHQRIDLSLRDGALFVDALLNPQPPNNRMKETIRRYRDIAGV